MFRVWLNRIWFGINSKILNFHDWTLYYNELFHDSRRSENQWIYRWICDIQIIWKLSYLLLLRIIHCFWTLCPGMSKVLQNNKAAISLGRVELFCLFLACSYISWKLQFCHVILVGYCLAYPKFSETTNHQYLWKGSCDFAFLQVVVSILLDIHWS